jgi:hypothetical protein
MKEVLAFGGCLLLAACGIEPDSWYCKQNGYTPGTDLYLQCLNDHAASRLSASAILLQNGQREMQGQ